MRRDYTFIADTDSLDAFRRLRGGWAGWALVDGEFHVRLRDGGTVRAHLDRTEAEPGFEISCLVADWWPDVGTVPARDSAFTSDANEVLVFRGVTWLEGPPTSAPIIPSSTAPSRATSCRRRRARSVISPTRWRSSRATRYSWCGRR